MTGSLFILRMGIGPGRDPAHIPDRRALRREIERQIETLLAVLDDMDGDTDTEDGGDAEPSLGWSTTMAIGSADDREDDGRDTHLPSTMRHP
ncbi:hypothetical protein ACLNGM_20195 [Aureimonas phyllosphaerae]|uniref:hypothetical protein n=1 Tax=Aureimonas phyllosphaerae TaxID=1166078 RepID=UPI003A5BA150